MLLDVPIVDQIDCMVTQICDLAWKELTVAEMISVAAAYYFFSVQFRENLQIACKIFPDDGGLRNLLSEESHTDNLSPYPGVAAIGERMDHDEFMRRTLRLSPLGGPAWERIMEAGTRYLSKIRNMDPMLRALSMQSYEDGGLERLFRAMLSAPAYRHPLLGAFRFFLSEHIRFDSDPQKGHGSLIRHLPHDERIAELWLAFNDLLFEVVPQLMHTDKARELNIAC